MSNARTDVAGPTGTRERILDAAVIEFAAASYDGVGVRQIAKRAGVAASLVIRYFGAKTELFAAALDHAFAEFDAATLKPAGLPRQLAILAMTTDQTGALSLGMRIAFRSAACREASEILRGFLGRAFLSPLARQLHGNTPALNAEMAAAVLIGFGMLHEILATDAFATKQRDVLIDLLEQVLKASLKPRR